MPSATGLSRKGTGIFMKRPGNPRLKGVTRISPFRARQLEGLKKRKLITIYSK